MTILTQKNAILLAISLLFSLHAHAAMSDHFVTSWKTDNPGFSNDTSITISVDNVAFNYLYDVDWNNDGIFDQLGVTGNISHDFGSPGIKTIRIQGDFPHITFKNLIDVEKIISIDQWGTFPWLSMKNAFKSTRNLVINATDTPNLSACSDLSNMFNGAESIGSASELGNWNWDVSNISDMSAMFVGATSFNQDIGSWNTTNVTNMQSLFRNASSFNQNLSGWDTNSVSDMSFMFAGATVFDQDISTWSTLNVTNMSFMFAGATAFNQDISSWDTSNVIDMSVMFQGASSFNQNISSWDISAAVDVGFMFAGASLFNQDISILDTSNITVMKGMFSGATSFNQDIGSWDTANVTDMEFMFWRATSFDQDISQWNVEKVSNFNRMFNNVRLSIEKYDALLIGWSTQNLMTDVAFSGGFSVYCSPAAQLAHDVLVNTFKWRIVDRGQCLPQLSIVSEDRIFVDENQTAILQVISTDPDFNNVSYAISGGEDSALFAINATTGELTFIAPMDYENPQDFNNDNTYIVEVMVTDDGVPMESDSQTITVLVKNAFENLANDDFVTTWKTDNPGSSNDSSITINALTPSLQYSFNVDWDNDGVFDEFGITGTVTHDFGVSGIKTIRISGLFPKFFFFNNAADDKEKLISIDQWGTNPWNSLFAAFKGARNVINNAIDIPNLASADIRLMFLDADSIGGVNESGNWNWDVSGTNSMARMFEGAQSFNQDIGQWNLSNVSNISSMFKNASAFNQDIGQWDTFVVESMFNIFDDASSFDQNLSQWKVNNVIYFQNMFNNISLSVENYDALLTAWSTQDLVTNRVFDAGHSIYCSAAAQNAHNYLTTTVGWTISDGGVCQPQLTIVSSDSVFVDENQTSVIQILTTDPDFDNVSFAITGGEDATYFAIDSVTGLLTFINPPDFENPLDFDNDNAYTVEVNATDDGVVVETAIQTLTVFINNVFEDLPSDHFVTTWKTDIPAESNATSITIKTLGGLDYSFNVDWDNDGIFDELGITTDITHDFGTPGIKTIRISGLFPYFFTGDKAKIIAIDQWGSNPWISMLGMFENASQLINKASDVPNLSNCSSMENMFSGASLVGADSETANWNWNTSQVRNMSKMFDHASSFNQDISTWNTSNVSDMSSMFSTATLFNQNIGGWDTSSVNDMSSMFTDASSFNQDINRWNTENVQTMSSLFLNASKFNQNLNSWNTSRVTDMSFMFSGETSFNQNIGNWDTSSVTSMRSMFEDNAFFNQDIGNWNTANVIRMTRMFSHASAFGQDLGLWNIENIVFLFEMFKGSLLSAENYNALLIGWSSQNAPLNRVFDAGNSIYCGSAAEAAHDNLTSTLGWEIHDMGLCEPELTVISSNIIFVDENQTFVVQLLATDPDFDNVNFIITGGIDQAFFTVDTLTGLLIFDSPPDYENPMDFDTNNAYEVEITATDDGVPIETVTQTITVYIRNLFENMANDDFVSTWKTDNPGSSNDSSITITATSQFAYSYNVDWDNDGTIDEFGITGSVTHDFGSPGIKTIRISGVFPAFFFFNGDDDDKEKIISIDQWGSNSWRSMSNMFAGTINLVNNASDSPNLSSCRMMNGMFAGALLIGSSGQANWNWDTTRITSMIELFKDASVFNRDISRWDTADVTNMSSMFENATLFNQDIGDWNTARVRFMSAMFKNAISFNQDIGHWNTGNVNSVSNMFEAATSFNRDISQWNVSNANQFSSMFNGAMLTVENYDALLTGWNSQNLNSSITFDGGDSIYCSQAAQDAHNNMTSVLNWSINDGGVCEPQLAIISNNFAQVEENHSTVIKVVTTDPDFDNVTFTISDGSDARLFSINANTGLLSFIDPPDFESPNSANNSNTYRIEVTAMDDGIPQEFVSQLISVTVTDLIETNPIDLDVQMTASTTSANNGETVEFSITVSNNGSEAAQESVLFDVLPSEIIHSSWICSASGTASCGASGTGEINDLVSIANDSSTVTYTVTARIGSEAFTALTYRVFVEATEPEFDTDLTNNSAAITITGDTIFLNGFD
jgi:uncharacterized repeat protein (TIGR01451 family)